MSAATATRVVLVVLVAVAAVLVAAENKRPPDEALEFRRRPRGGGRQRRVNRPSPPARPGRTSTPTPPVPIPSVTPPAGPGGLLPCNRSVVPIMVGPGGVPVMPSTPPCIPSPPPPPSPPTPTPPHGRRCQPCACSKPAHPLPFPYSPVPGSSGAGGLGDAEGCVTPLAWLMSCEPFLTGGTDEAAPTRTSDCCAGLGNFLNASSAAAATGGGDRVLRCLCPVILGGINWALPKPIDPVRLMYLPIGCGMVLPPQILYICFTGELTPRVGGHVPTWNRN